MVVGEVWAPFIWTCKLAHRFPYWSNIPCRSMRTSLFLTRLLFAFSFFEKEVVENNATTSVPALPSPFLKVPLTSLCTVPHTGPPLSCLVRIVEMYSSRKDFF
jgi:hypothetical protein